jgi:hypothetical protein
VTAQSAAYLLPGEDPDNIKDGDVEHWIAAYKDLLRGTRRLLDEMPNFSHSEIEAPSLELRAARLEARLAFWRGLR